jgi:branched-chain amino acid transport system ATP-binding protein
MIARRGDIAFDGVRIDAMAAEDIARLGLAHVPDGRGTIDSLTTEENLRLGAYTRPASPEVERDFARVYQYFPRLAERRRQQAGTLSGGEQQMLAIGRALMLRPKLLVLDEPSFGLAPLVIEEIFGILRRIKAEHQTSVLLVEQNAHLALEIADCVCLLETGRVVKTGPPEELRRDEAIRRAYFGD